VSGILQILVCDDIENELADISRHFAAYFAAGADAESDQSAYSLLCFDDPHDALDIIQNGKHIDVAILDIIMPEMSGMELAERFRKLGYKGYIVFLTTVNDYAAQSYGVEAFDYLLKPVSEPAIAKLMDKLILDHQNSDNASFAVKVKTEMRRIKYKELVYAEVINHNLYFYLDGGETITAYAPLKEYADTLLEDRRMIRASNSFIINIDYISSFEKQSVKIRNGTKISVTGSFKDFKVKCYGRMFGGDGK